MDKEKCPVCKTNNVLIEDLKLEGKDTKSYLCIRCGYTSNSEYIINSEIMKKMIDGNEYSETLFNLHLYDEDTGLYWFPMVLLTKHGAIFPEGTHDNFKWSYVPIIDVEPEKQEEIGEEYTRRFAIELKEQFDKLDFLTVCKKMGAIDPSLVAD